MTKIQKIKCTKEVLGQVIDIVHKEGSQTSAIEVKYSINDQTYVIKEALQRKYRKTSIGQMLHKNKITYKINEVKVGDILTVMINPDNPSMAYILENNTSNC